jgi:hypothetical protein
LRPPPAPVTLPPRSDLGPRPEPVVGHRLIAVGVTRPAHLDAAGKQYVLGPEGERVPGLWVLPPEVPPDPPPPTETPP